MRISDWSSDVCSSDLRPAVAARGSGRWCRLLRRRFRRVPVAAVLSGRVKEYRPHQALTRNSADTEIRIRAFAQPRFCATPLPRLRCRPATRVDFPASTDERCVGKEWFNTVKYRWAPNSKKKKKQTS